jgi:hypothetical protein
MFKLASGFAFEIGQIPSRLKKFKFQFLILGEAMGWRPCSVQAIHGPQVTR